MRSLRLHYESSTAEELTRKIRSIKSLHGIATPMIKVESGFIPDFGSRYFTADFPYGLSIIHQMADIAGVQVPGITETLKWYYEVTGRGEELCLAEYGLLTCEDVDRFYR